MPDITALLVDYVSDELSAAAKAEVEARLVADPVFRAKAEPLLAAWRSAPTYADDPTAVEALRRELTITDRRPVKWVTIGVAAAVACAVMSVYGPGFYRILAPVFAGHKVVGYATGVGERRTVRLPDGSQATLGPESRLQYKATFFKPVPQVVVNGTVDFDVAGPIVVHAGSAGVRASRGHFDVEDYAEGRDVRVTALDSSVDVLGWAVAAGATVHVIDSAVVFRRTSDEGTVAWDGNQLRLVRLPVAEAVRAMRRWYGISARAALAALQARGVWDGDRVSFSKGLDTR